MSHPAPVSGLKNPARTARSLGSGLLVMQAIVVALAIPVISHGTHHGATPNWVLGGIAVALVLTAGMVGRPVGLVVGSLLQVATIAAGVWSSTLLFLGVIFAGLWASWLWLRRSLLSSPAERPVDPDARADQ